MNRSIDVLFLFRNTRVNQILIEIIENYNQSVSVAWSTPCGETDWQFFKYV